MTKFLSIASGKGGVGKTITAINLGTALSSFGADVLVVDGNLFTPNLGLYLGVQKLPVTIHDAVKGLKHIRETVYQHSSGLKIIPASISIEDNKNIDIGSLGKIMLDLYGAAQIVLIDSSAGIGEEAKSEINASDEMLIVVTPDSSSIADGLKILNTAMENGVKAKGIIVNRWHEDSEFSLESIRALFNLPVYAIPESPEMKKACCRAYGAGV